MSLRAFHIVFIIVTVVLSLYVALWGIREFAQERETSNLIIGIFSFITAIGLMVYGKKAFTKLRDLP